MDDSRNFKFTIMLELIKQAKLEYLSDTSWTYKFENQFYVIDFWQDDAGRNHVEQYLQQIDFYWCEIEPTDEELKLMWQMLNDTPYRPVEPISESIGNPYTYNGVKESDFY